MSLTYIRKKEFEICCCTIVGAECINKMLLLNSWKFIWSEIRKFMFFFNGFFILTVSVVFGDNEYSEGFSISFSSKILTTFSISLFLLLLFLPFPSLPTDFWAPFKANALTDAPHFDRLNYSTNCWSFPNFSAIAMTCAQIFVLLLMQLLSHLKDPRTM